jgi:hypothetical protein
MGLPVRQRRVLERIESALRGSDPKLAGLYAFFSRLTRDEDMPRIEQLRHRAMRAFARLRPVPAAATAAGVGSRRPPTLRTMIFLPVVLALAVTSIVFAIRSTSSYGCAPVQQAAAAKYIAKTRLCRPPATLSFMGH